MHPPLQQSADVGTKLNIITLRSSIRLLFALLMTFGLFSAIDRQLQQIVDKLPPPSKQIRQSVDVDIKLNTIILRDSFILFYALCLLFRCYPTL